MGNCSIRTGSLCSINRELGTQGDKKAFRVYRRLFVFTSLLFYVSTYLRVYQSLIKPNRVIHLSRVFINATTDAENILPALLREPGCDLSTAVAVMTQDINRGIL